MQKIIVKVIEAENAGNRNKRNSLLPQVDVKLNLQKIREKLEKDSVIKMDNTLIFLHDNAISMDNTIKRESINKESINITRENEAHYKLEDIIHNHPHPTIYLGKCPTPNLDHLKTSSKLKLMFGRSLTSESTEIKIANCQVLDHSVFTMENIKLTELNKPYHESVEINSKESWTKRVNTFLNAEADMMDFGSLGISFAQTQNETHQYERKLSCKFTKLAKMSLEVDKLKPTQEFIENVKKVISSKDRESFGVISRKFGQFVPTEVILGGIVYDVTEEQLNENFRQDNTRADAHLGNPSLQAGHGHTSEQAASTRNKKNYIKLTGGESKTPGNFNKDDWIKSLDDYETWECIEFRKPINVFQLLDSELRKKLYEFFGKKILYSDIMNHSCQLEYGEREIIKLSLQGKNKKDSECKVFATVVDVDEEKNDFFNCQIYHPQNETPQLVIHCYQKKQKNKPRNLKIGFMIIGYDIDFNLNNLRDEMQLEVYDLNFEKEGIKEQKLEFNSDPKSVKSLLGIPVLEDLSNESILIGHNFLKNKREVNVFSFDLTKNEYVDLPNFRFQVLAISGNSKAYGKFPFETKFMRRKKYIDLMKLERYARTTTKTEIENHANSTGIGENIPLYISVYSENYGQNCNPVFLKQKKKGIKLKYAKCNKACSLCKHKLSDTNNYIYYYAGIRNSHTVR